MSRDAPLACEVQSRSDVGSGFPVSSKKERERFNASTATIAKTSAENEAACFPESEADAGERPGARDEVIDASQDQPELDWGLAAGRSVQWSMISGPTTAATNLQKYAAAYTEEGQEALAKFQATLKSRALEKLDDAGAYVQKADQQFSGTTTADAIATLRTALAKDSQAVQQISELRQMKARLAAKLSEAERECDLALLTGTVQQQVEAAQAVTAIGEQARELDLAIAALEQARTELRVEIPALAVIDPTAASSLNDRDLTACVHQGFDRVRAAIADAKTKINAGELDLGKLDRLITDVKVECGISEENLRDGDVMSAAVLEWEKREAATDRALEIAGLALATAFEIVALATTGPAAIVFAALGTGIGGGIAASSYLSASELCAIADAQLPGGPELVDGENARAARALAFTTLLLAGVSAATLARGMVNTAQAVKLARCYASAEDASRIARLNPQQLAQLDKALRLTSQGASQEAAAIMRALEREMPADVFSAAKTFFAERSAAFTRLARTLPAEEVARLHATLGDGPFMRLSKIDGQQLARLRDAIGTRGLANLARDVDGGQILRLERQIGIDALAKLAPHATGRQLRDLLLKHGKDCVQKFALELDGQTAFRVLDQLDRAALEGLKKIEPKDVVRFLDRFGSTALNRAAPAMKAAGIQRLIDTVGKNSARAILREKIDPARLEQIALELEDEALRQFIGRLDRKAVTRVLAYGGKPSQIREVVLGGELIAGAPAGTGARILQDVSKRNATELDAAAKLVALERRDGGHALLRHGPFLTDGELQRRITTGIAPDGMPSPFKASSRFESYETMLKTRAVGEEKAFAALGIKQGQPAATGKVELTVKVDFGQNVGTGFVGAGSPKAIPHPNGSAKTINVHPSTAVAPGPITRVQVTVSWDGSRWSTKQHFPIAGSMDPATGGYTQAPTHAGTL